MILVTRVEVKYIIRLFVMYLHARWRDGGGSMK